MSDNYAPPAGESTAETMAALTQYLPGYMKVLNQEVLPQSLAELEAAQNISPKYQRLVTDLYKQFAPELAQTGSEVDRTTRLNTAKTDAEILAGSGKDLAKAYTEIDREQNPEYYDVRAKAASSLSDVLNSLNLSNPDPEAERLVAQESQRTGAASVPSNASTVANAMNFGSIKQGRISNLTNAINSASAFLQPASNAQFNPATAALNRPVSSAGTSQFGGITNPNQTAYNQGSNLMGTIAGFQSQANDINANRRDVLDRVNESVSAVGSLS